MDDLRKKNVYYTVVLIWEYQCQKRIVTIIGASRLCLKWHVFNSRRLHSIVVSCRRRKTLGHCGKHGHAIGATLCRPFIVVLRQHRRNQVNWLNWSVREPTRSDHERTQMQIRDRSFIAHNSYAGLLHPKTQIFQNGISKTKNYNLFKNHMSNFKFF